MDLISGSKVGKSYPNHTLKNLDLDKEILKLDLGYIDLGQTKISWVFGSILQASNYVHLDWMWLKSDLHHKEFKWMRTS